MIQKSISIRSLQFELKKQHKLPERDPTGTHDQSLHKTVRNLLESKLAEMKMMFKPVLFVYGVNVIDQPHELITCNLHLALIRKNLQRKKIP